MNAETSAVLAARELGSRLDPDRVVMSGPAYDKALRLWNGAVNHRPALVVQPRTSTEVSAAVLAARRHHLPLSVRSGGHDWAGRALRTEGLVIDLSEMRQVMADPQARAAIVQGGASAGDVVAAAAPHDLSAATGSTGDVGMAGLTLGGGYGALNGRFGLALDNLLGAEVVLADGRVVTTDAEQEPELFWALRGGGGNFGVVTSMRIRLHPVHRLQAGFLMYPWSQAADIWRRLGKLLPDAPDELTVQTGAVSAPDGSPAMLLSPSWSGDPATGEKVIEEVRRLGTPLLSQVAPMTYGEMLQLWDAFVVNGNHYELRTRSVAEFSPEVVAALVDAGSTRTTPLSALSIHHFHGAATRVPDASTAFGIRRPHFLVEILAAWEPDDTDGERHRRWADSVSTALAPAALPGGYANLLGPDDGEQIADAYGANAARLRQAKAKFDPESIFSATPLPSA